MAKTDSTCIVRVEESEIREYLDKQVREAVKRVLEEIMNAEAEELICAGPYERSEGRRDHRNGTRRRKIKTRVGEIELSVPRLRTQAFQTMIFERYRRMEISLEEALVEMYLLGVSTRKVKDVTEALSGFPISSTTQSRLNKKVYEKLEEWRMRPISPVIPYLWTGGIVMKVRIAAKYENVSLLVAIGPAPEGHREVLGIAPGFQEDKGSWLSFLRWLKKKGLEYVGLCTSDAHLGIREALSECFPQADWQRCTVHFYRNILSFCPRRLRCDLAASLKTIHNQESAEEARAKAKRVVDRWRSLLPEACSVLEEGLEDTLTFYSYPRAHLRHIRSNNPLERLFREVRRRTRVVGVFPDLTSCLMLAAARLKWTEERRREKKRYMDIDLLLEELIQRAQKVKTAGA
jgi:transposase-like protein